MDKFDKRGKKVMPACTLFQLWGKADKNAVSVKTDVVENNTSSESNKQNSKWLPESSQIPTDNKSTFVPEIEVRKEKVTDRATNPALVDSTCSSISTSNTSSSTVPDSKEEENTLNSKQGLRDRLPSGLTKGLPVNDGNKEIISKPTNLPGDVLKFNTKKKITKENKSVDKVRNVSSSGMVDTVCLDKDRTREAACPTVDQIEFEEAMAVLANDSFDIEQEVLCNKYLNSSDDVCGISNLCDHGQAVPVIEKRSADEPTLELLNPSSEHPSDQQLSTSTGLEKCIPHGDYPLICFDLETTGLSLDDEIVQISACGIIDGKRQEFNQYVLPSKRMAPGASKVTGIKIRRGCLYHNRAKVQTCSILQALNKFLHWLKTFPKSVLVAHNALFDSRMLLKSCVQYNLVQFGLMKAVFGFIDTLPAMKEIHPGRKTYQLEALVTDVLKVKFNAHDAREDTRILLKLIMEKSVDETVLFKHSFSVHFAEENYRALAEKKKNMKSLKELVDASVLSKGMAERIAGSGLTKKDLTSVVEEKGLDGIREVLQADNNGKPKITNRTAIMQNLYDHLARPDS